MPASHRLMSISPLLLLLAFSLTLSLADSCNRKKPTPEEVIKARQKIGEARSLTERSVQHIKGTYSVNQVEYVTARNKYDLAETKYNTWLSNLAQGIREQTNLESPAYKQIARETEKAGEDFLKYVDELTKLPTEKTPGFPVLSPRFGGASDFIKGLANIGITIWAATKEEERKQRAYEADQLETKFQWKKWDSI